MQWLIDLIKAWVTAQAYATVAWVTAQIEYLENYIDGEIDAVGIEIGNQVDLMHDWVEAKGYLTTGFVDRGDPAANDFATGDFAKDAAWHDLDLSAIVPVGTKAVAGRLQLNNEAIDRVAYFREKGNANTFNVSLNTTLVANVNHWEDIIFSVDSNRKAQYLVSAAGWTAITLTIKGWWL